MARTSCAAEIGPGDDDRAESGDLLCDLGLAMPLAPGMPN
jgi:hypothetical protein